jgi:ABC-type multidrug transport system ATPase subunit
VKFALLSQHLSELAEVENLRVREVLSRYKTRYEIDGKEMTPTQALEHLGFETAQLSTPVRDLSGGEKRRFQLMLILLERPNVLILDEPDNDLDIDMLAVVESLLDSWPGTLLLITHDRYLMERVTDDQYALMDGKLSHVPGGVDEYLQRLEGRSRRQLAAKADKGESDGQRPAAALSYADERSLKKELAATERRLNILGLKADAIRGEMDAANPSDYVALGEIQGRLADVKREISDLEDTWVELSERLA